MMLVHGFLLKWYNCTSFLCYGWWCPLVSMVWLPREDLVIRLCECVWFTFGWVAAAAESQSYPVREGCFNEMDILLSGASVERDFWLACGPVFLEIQPRRFWVHVGCSLFSNGGSLSKNLATVSLDECSLCVCGSLWTWLLVSPPIDQQRGSLLGGLAAWISLFVLQNYWINEFCAQKNLYLREFEF